MNFKRISSFLTHLHNLTKTADIAWAFDWMARMVSLLLPAQNPPASAPPIAVWVLIEVGPAFAAPIAVWAIGSPPEVIGFDCSMIVHSASCTVLSSWSHNCTGLGRLKNKKKLNLVITYVKTFVSIHSFFAEVFTMTNSSFCF